MKQKRTFTILFFSIVSLIALFFWNTTNQKIKLRQLKKSIGAINSQLISHKNILKETVEIENDLIQKKDKLISQFSLSKRIINEIESIKSLARDFKVNIENIKVDRRDTFLPLNQALNKDGFALERHTLSFQLSGKFISIGEFLEDQNNKFENILLSQCVFNMDSLDPKGVVAQLEFNIYGNKQ